MNFKELFEPTFSKITLFIFISLVFIPFIHFDTGIRCIMAPCPAGTFGSLLTYLLFSYKFRIYYISYTILIVGLLISYIVSCVLIELSKKWYFLEKLFKRKTAIIVILIFVGLFLLSRSDEIYEVGTNYYHILNPDSCRNVAEGWIGAINDCYFDVAVARNDVTFCDKIQEQAERPGHRRACYFVTARDNKNEQICEQIESKFPSDSKESCMNLLGMYLD